MGRAYSTIWSEDFTDDFADEAIRQWLETGTHRARHVATCATWTSRRLDARSGRAGPGAGRRAGATKAIIGVFDEGCMGMYNAIIDDELLNPMGIYKERLSQSALVAEMRR